MTEMWAALLALAIGAVAGSVITLLVLRWQEARYERETNGRA